MLRLTSKGFALRSSSKSHEKIFQLWSCGLPQLRGKIFAFGTSVKCDVIYNCGHFLESLMLAFLQYSKIFITHWLLSVKSLNKRFALVRHPVGGNPRLTSVSDENFQSKSITSLNKIKRFSKASAQITALRDFYPRNVTTTFFAPCSRYEPSPLHFVRRSGYITAIIRFRSAPHYVGRCTTPKSYTKFLYSLWSLKISLTCSGSAIWEPRCHPCRTSDNCDVKRNFSIAFTTVTLYFLTTL